jgi:MFS family permease
VFDLVTVDRKLVSIVMWRVVPLITLSYVAAIIDRANVSFAKIQMVSALHMTEQQYGLASSLYFIGYLAFEIPSALALHHYGARRWIARIMLTWGVVNLLIAFTSSATEFYILRFLLGAAEAGLYPGAIYYLTLWLPQRDQSRLLSCLTIGGAIGNMSGSLLGGSLLALDQTFGIAGWQWVFLLTSAPPLALAYLVLRFLPDSPQQAHFLDSGQKQRLASVLAEQDLERADRGRLTGIFVDPRMLFLALIYTLIITALFGVIYWMPTVIHEFGASARQNGILSALPWLVSIVVLTLYALRPKATRALLATIGLVASLSFVTFLGVVHLNSLFWQFICMAIALPCTQLLLPCFWTLPSRFFTGARAVTAIATITMLGSVGGFFAQNLMPWAAKVGGSSVSALLVPAACVGLLSIGCLAFYLVRSLTSVPAAKA